MDVCTPYSKYGNYLEGVGFIPSGSPTKAMQLLLGQKLIAESSLKADGMEGSSSLFRSSPQEGTLKTCNSTGHLASPQVREQEGGGKQEILRRNRGTPLPSSPVYLPSIDVTETNSSQTQLKLILVFSSVFTKVANMFCDPAMIQACSPVRVLDPLLEYYPQKWSRWAEGSAASKEQHLELTSRQLKGKLHFQILQTDAKGHAPSDPRNKQHLCTSANLGKQHATSFGPHKPRNGAWDY